MDSNKLKYTHNPTKILLAILFASLTSIDLESQEIKIKPIKANVPIAKPDVEHIPLFAVSPVYPRRAKEYGTEGFSIVSFTITESGTVKDAKAIEGYCGDPKGPKEAMRPCILFNSASVKAAKKLKYKPKIIDGKAVAVNDAVHRFTFVLSK